MLQKLIAPFRTSVFFHTLAADALTLILMGSGVWLSILSLRGAGEKLTAGQSAETFQSYLLSLPPEQLAAFSGQLKAFVVQFIVWLVLVPVAVFLVFAVSRAVVWHLLEKKEWHVRYSQWIGMGVIAAVLFIAAFAIYGILHLFVASFLSGTLLALVQALLLSVILASYLTVKYVAFASFMEQRKVWASWGTAFGQFTVPSLLLTCAGAFLLLQLIQYPLGTWYFVHPLGAAVVQLGIFLVFVTWMRLFVVQEIDKNR